LQAATQRTQYTGGAERAVLQVKGDLAGLCFMDRLRTAREFLPKSRKPDARLVYYEVAEELFPILPRVLPKDAKQKDDMARFNTKSAEALEQAEAARTSAFQAIETFAKVAKNQSDRGAIATMAEYVYRPLKRKLEELRREYESGTREIRNGR
jgi:hypothetical protein